MRPQVTKKSKILYIPLNVPLKSDDIQCRYLLEMKELDLDKVAFH